MKRRDFIKSVGIGSAALAIVPVSLISAKKVSEPLSASVEYTNWDRPIYPEIREYWEHGMMMPSDGITSHMKVNNDGTRYHLLSYVPNRHEESGYSICRRTYVFDNENFKHRDKIAEDEMEMMIEECERVLKSPENYVYIKEL